MLNLILDWVGGVYPREVISPLNYDYFLFIWKGHICFFQTFSHLELPEPELHPG